MLYFAGKLPVVILIIIVLNKVQTPVCRVTENRKKRL